MADKKINTNLVVDGSLSATGSIESTAFVTDGGESPQFVKGDGSLDSSTYLTSFDITTQTDPKYLRSDVANTSNGLITFNSGASIATGNLTLKDTQRIRFGTSGGESYIVSNGTFTKWDLLNGDLQIRDNDVTRFTFERTTGNFGIGTDSPESNLEISDSTQAIGATLSITNAHNGSWVTGDKIGSIDFRIDDPSTTQFVRAKIHAEGKTTGTFPSNSQLVFSTANSNTLSESMRIDSDGNVGIGTTSPQEKLHVQNYATGESHQALFKGGALTAGDYAYISLNNGYAAEYTKEVRLAAVSEAAASNKTGFAILTSPNANGASGNERLRVTADGNVGIGTTSPTHKLEVFETDTSQSVNVGAFEFRAVSNHGSSSNLFYHRQDANQIVVNEDGADLDFRVEGSSDANLFKVDSGLNRVGIGTSGPGSKLHVAGASGELLRLDDSSATGNPFMTFYQNGTRRSLIQHVDSGDNLSLVSEYGGIRMMTGTGGTEVNRFEINNAGRTMFARQGITGSMTASIYDVNITGDDFSDKYLTFWSQDGTNNPRAWLKHSSSASTQEIEFNSVFSTGSGYANFAFRRGTTPIMFLNQATQRVGIGTETPSFDLDVTGDTGIRISSPTDLPLRVLSTDATCGIELADSVHAYYMLTTGTDFRVRDVTGGNVDRFTIEGTTGNIGIGTTGPGERLHVADNGDTTVIIEDTDTSKASNANLIFKAAGTEIVKVEAVVGASNASSGGGLIIKTATNNSGGYNNHILSLANNNRVGIGGALEPRSTLDVNGGVKIGDDTDTALSAKVGTLRYRTSGNNSYVDMCMQTGASTYAWINIQTNSW